MYYVYYHRKKTDNSVFYVGKGKGSRAFDFSRRSDYWKRTKQKHGVFVEIVFSNLTEHQAFFIERKAIQKFGLENLCNITSGGEGASVPWPKESRDKRVKAINEACKKEEWKKKNKEWTSSERFKKIASHRSRKLWSKEEFRRRQSEAVKKWAQSEENRQRVSKQWAGKKRSDETKRKMSEAQKNIHRSESRLKAFSDLGRKRKKPIFCVEESRVFSCVKDAAEWLRNNGSDQKAIDANIRHALKGRNPSACGFTWKYLG